MYHVHTVYLLKYTVQAKTNKQAEPLQLCSKFTYPLQNIYYPTKIFYIIIYKIIIKKCI